MCTKTFEYNNRGGDTHSTHCTHCAPELRARASDFHSILALGIRRALSRPSWATQEVAIRTYSSERCEFTRTIFNSIYPMAFAGASRRRGIALLVVDAQRGFVSARMRSEFQHLDDRIAGALRFFRAENLPVLHVRERFHRDGSDWLPPYILAGRAPVLEASADMEPLECAAALPSETVLHKSTWDPWVSTHLERELRDLDCRMLYVAGVATSVCVLQAAVGAINRGIMCTVLSDACADHKDAHDIVIERYARFGGLRFATVDGIDAAALVEDEAVVATLRAHHSAKM